MISAHADLTLCGAVKQEENGTGGIPIEALTSSCSIPSGEAVDLRAAQGSVALHLVNCNQTAERLVTSPSEGEQDPVRLRQAPSNFFEAVDAD